MGWVRKTGCDGREVREAQKGMRKDHGTASGRRVNGRITAGPGSRVWGPDFGARVRSELGLSREWSGETEIERA